MGIYILWVIVTVVATLLAAREILAEDFMDWCASALIGLVFGVIAMVVAIIPAFTVSTSPVPTHKQSIYAIKDSNEMHGNFSLGFGSVDEESYYYYVTEDSNGFKAVKKLKVSSSKIKEENIAKPYVQVYEQRYNSAVARFMYGEYSGDESYAFHVPKHTITTEYKVDME